MTGSHRDTGAEAARTPAEPEDIRRDIEQTRADLGETAEALAYKADVPARAKEKLHDTTAAAQAKAIEVTAHAEDIAGRVVATTETRAEQAGTLVRRPIPAAVAAAVAALVTWRLARRLRKDRAS
ncbi:hypothetical protein BJY24_004277 [Nocardia transvalensis]|uniref:DUF3618 domain-containing protein n=1 Tax=Nocardia transvalensis TaxID=37333 RepID=A0A7W9PFY9_9NOCA|nr:DUF3618 domain-containing protein [Nocardia transvalensis]MBB5915365.1 hypothetical protein [Nocardia transvalensis]